MPDVFISYTENAPTVLGIAPASELTDALAVAGIRSFSFASDLETGDDLGEVIADALLGCRVFVAFVGHSYFESDPCRREWNAALAPWELAHTAGDENLAADALSWIVIARGPDRAEQETAGYSMPPALRDTWANRETDTGHLVEHIANLLASGPLPTLSARLGAKRALDLRARLVATERVPGRQSLGAIPVYPIALPESLGSAFVGRADELYRIHNLLRPTRASAGTCVVIEGGGGMGKTRLAIEYVHRYGPAAFKAGIFWVDADLDRADIEDQLHGILSTLEPDTKPLTELRSQGANVRALLARALRDGREKGSLLYVVDGIPEPGTHPLAGTGLVPWCPAPDAVALLVTSRRSEAFGQGLPTIALEELSLTSAVELLTDGLEPQPGANWSAIARWVGRLPLALTLLNRALATRAIHEAGLVAQAQDSGPALYLDDQMESLRGQIDDRYLKGVTETFEISFRALSPTAQDLCRLVAFLAPTPVPMALVGALDDAYRARKSERQQARVELTTRSFVLGTASGNEPTYGRMHPLLADYIRGLSSARDAAALVCDLGDAMIELLKRSSPDDPERRPLIGLLVPHAQVVADRLGAISATSADETSGLRAAGIRDWLGLAFLAQGDLRLAKSSFEESLRAFRAIRGADDLDSLRIAGNLANALSALGDHQAARLVYQQLFDAFRNWLGQDHPDTILAAANLALTMRENEPGNARELQEMVLAVRSRDLGPDSPLTLTAAGDLANTIAELGDLSDALNRQESVWRARVRVLGNDHPQTLNSIRDVALTRRRMGEPEVARDLLKEGLKTSSRTLGVAHPATLAAAHSLGLTLFSLGDFADARKIQDRVFIARARVLGEEHPDTLMSANNLALTFWYDGSIADARDLQQWVVGTLTRARGPHDPAVKRARDLLEAINRGPPD